MLRQLSFEYVLSNAGLERGRRISLDPQGRIASIEAAAAGPWDATLVVPGMPNAHSHAFQRALTGVRETTANDSFWSWRETMYRIANALDADDLYVVALRAFADMLRAGFTAVGEFHYLHHAADGAATAEMALAIRAAARDAGIRLTLLPVLYQQGGFGRPPTPEQRRFVHRSLDEFARLLQQLAGEPCGVAPHSLRAVPLEVLPDLVELADDLLGPRCPIHIHVSEQRLEVMECCERYGVPPIECLARTINLDERWNLVHATHAEPQELDLIISRGSTLVLCPLTEAYLGDGLFPLARFAARGGVFAIGSDSNARIDAIEELRLAEYGQRLREQRRGLLARSEGLGATLWSQAASAGARALGQPVGAFEVGAFADFVALDLEDPLFAGVSAPQALDAWIIGGSAAQIAAVYVGGERRVEHGEVALPAAVARFPAIMRKLHNPSSTAA
ncbi:MAG TPA: formimidoylglutamate deiminase [Steroidobacteraceae bacterium]|nr:formimidoylglutamate deiminase [Steroidobacteraceae bacterium]